MESAALTQAHQHVRTAAAATLDKSIATAGHQHDLAAAAFRQAAQETKNAEALRILALLEHHHRQLAGLIKETPRAVDGSSTTVLAAKPPAGRPSATAAPRRRLPQSSIASNLAEKRGIRSPRGASSDAAGHAAGMVNSRPEPSSTAAPSPAATATATAASLAQTPGKAEAGKAKETGSSAEDNFRYFYSAFGGVISAMSAPLAFTSLPLNPLAAPSPAQDKAGETARQRAQSPEPSPTVRSSLPDLAALISKPALRALREDGAPPLGPNESFYLVPTTGTAVTYASILRDPNTPAAAAAEAVVHQAADGMRGSSHDEFVDARENPPSPTTARRPRSRRPSASGVTTQRTIAAGRGSGLKTMEELALENETLKSLVDSQAKRIQMWETNSQNSFNALAQSFRTRDSRPGRPPTDSSPPLPHPLSSLAHARARAASPPSGQPSPPRADSSQPRRMADLEALLASQTAKVNDLMTNNEQLAKKHERDSQLLRRYREQWEKLKAGARKKEQERLEKKASQATTAAAAAADNNTAMHQGSGVTVQEAQDEIEAEAEAKAKAQEESAAAAAAVEPDFGKA